MSFYKFGHKTVIEKWSMYEHFNNIFQNVCVLCILRNFPHMEIVIKSDILIKVQYMTVIRTSVFHNKYSCMNHLSGLFEATTGKFAFL